MLPKRYTAFISYSHADHVAARWLHRALETYRFPRDVRPSSTDENRPVDRLGPIFLDREEFSSSSDLAASVRLALHSSDWLIVVCSPNAAKSRWVNEEVRTFKELGRADRILCLVVDGEPGFGAIDEANCFPPAIRFEVTAGIVTNRSAAEPLAADIRGGKAARRDAKLRIIAGLLQLPLDELRRREQGRRQQRLALLSTAAVIGSVLFAGLALFAWNARNEAERQRKIAVQKSTTAERTAAFMVSLFEVSDPSEARGNTITAREILDRGARQVKVELRDEPLVRSEFSAALGRVYYGLGLYGPASDLLIEARSVPNQDPRAVAAESLTLGDINWARGDYVQAERLYQDADRRVRSERTIDPALHARALVGLGDAASMQQHYAEASHFFADALQIADAPTVDLAVKARVLESLGSTNVDSGHLDLANDWYKKALELRTRISGDTHPRVLDTLNNLGAIAYLKGDSKTAGIYWSRLMNVDRRVRGPHHPEVAVTLNNLGLLKLEQRQFAAAMPMLSEAWAIQAAQRNGNQDDLIFVLNNLARAKFGLGDIEGARSHFVQALNATLATNHRLRAPILTDLANLECRKGHFDAGLKRLVEGRPIMAQRYPDDPWRVAHVDNVRAGCLTGLKRYAEAKALMSSSLPIILKKWPPNTLYGHDALERAVRLYTRTGDTARVDAYREQLQEK